MLHVTRITAISHAHHMFNWIVRFSSQLILWSLRTNVLVADKYYHFKKTLMLRCVSLSPSLFSAVTRDIGMIKMSGDPQLEPLSKNIFITPSIISLPDSRWVPTYKAAVPTPPRLGLMPLNGQSSKYPPTQMPGPGSKLASNSVRSVFMGFFTKRTFPENILFKGSFLPT